MAPAVILASDVMDTAAAILNDTLRKLYTNTIQLPYLKLANRQLEQLLAVYGLNITKEKSTKIEVAAEALTLTLPNDFLYPVRLSERANDDTSDDHWVEMTEGAWEGTREPGPSLALWAFRDNAINFPGCSTAREVQLEYIRILTAIASASTAIDEYKLQNWLAAKTAELCARYIGMNKDIANEIRDNEVFLAEDSLVRIFIGGQQAVRHRRGQYTAKKSLI